MARGEPQVIESAKTKTLKIPELLHAILLELRNIWAHQGDPTILKCSLVNRLWESESRRVIWEHCVASDTRANQPRIGYLIAMDQRRRQRYANHIKSLVTGNDIGCSECKQDDQSHFELAALSYPRLEKLRIRVLGCADQNLNRSHIIALKPYLQPRLRTIVIYSFDESDSLIISDDFLHELSNRSKNLEHIHFSTDPECFTASKSAVTNLIRSLKSLNRIGLGREPINSISLEAFVCLSRSYSLEQLQIYGIQSDWVNALEPNAFKALRSLTCSISSDGLERLLRFLPDLRFLIVQATSGSTDIVKIISLARLRHLRQLILYPCPKTAFSVNDLIGIADGAIELQSLNIGKHTENGAHFFAAIADLNDSTMFDLVTRLPKLKDITLLSEDSKLTEQSLISFGTQCPNLRYYRLNAVVDVRRLIEQTSVGKFSCLEHFLITGSPGVADDEVSADDLRSMAEALLQIMPSLQTIELSSQPRLAHTLQELIKDAGKVRA